MNTGDYVALLSAFIPILIAAFAGAFAYTHFRINRLEDITSKADTQVWLAIDKMRDDSSAFRERVLASMVTREDMHAMEERIVSSLKRI